MTAAKLGMEAAKALATVAGPAISRAAAQTTRNVAKALSSEPMRAVERQVAQQALSAATASVFQAANTQAQAARERPAPDVAGQKPDPAAGAIVPRASRAIVPATTGWSQEAYRARLSGGENRLVPYTPPDRSNASQALTVAGQAIATEIGGRVVDHVVGRFTGGGAKGSPAEAGATPPPSKSDIFGAAAGALIEQAPQFRRSESTNGGAAPSGGSSEPAGRPASSSGGGHAPGQTGAQPGANGASASGQASGGAGNPGGGGAPGQTGAQPGANGASASGQASGGADNPGGAHPESAAGPAPFGPSSEAYRTDTAETGKRMTPDEARAYATEQSDRMLVDEIMSQVERQRNNMKHRTVMEDVSDSMSRLKETQQKLSQAAGY